jgi:eukaryotic-like serine/threonine-protein kinase
MTDCLDDDAIANLSAGALDEAERAALTAHIDVCEACRTLVADAAPAVEGVEAAQQRPGAAPGIGEALIGETLDRKYKLVGLLGEGGMGSVYEARHTGTSRRVAVKLIRPDKLAPGGTAESRFRREARAAGAIRSPHIVEILDSGTDEATGHLYLVMEHLAGEDLKHLLDRRGPLPCDVALRIAGQALAGLARAHAAGVVHRDIKPANLFLAREDEGSVRVKVLDFGVAKVRPDPLRGPETLGLTDTGGFLGSPLYMSPEQVQSSKDVDARADVWSLGCVLYAALAGRAPHQDIESFGRLIVAICGTPAPPLRDVAPGVPEEVAAVVHRALAIDPAERTPSAAAMLEAIRALSPGGLALREEMLHAGPAVPRSERPARSDTTTGGQEGAWRAGRRARVALVAVLAVGIGGALGYLLTRPAGPVAVASPSSMGAAPAMPPAPSSTEVKGDVTSKPPPEAPPRAPVVSKIVTPPAVVRAPVVPVAPRTSSPKSTADPLIPADPP